MGTQVSWRTTSRQSNILGKQVILRRYFKNTNACRRGYRLRYRMHTRARIQAPLQNTRFQYVDYRSKWTKLHRCYMHWDMRLRVCQSIDLDEVDCAGLKSTPSAQSKVIKFGMTDVERTTGTLKREPSPIFTSEPLLGFCSVAFISLLKLPFLYRLLQI
jgi:hypothetical protein